MITIKIQLPHLEDKLKTFMKGGEGYDSVIRGVATSMLGVVKKRIHEEGKAADGASIGAGKYSTKEMWASKSSFVGSGFSPQGKIRTGTKTVKAGTEYKKIETLYYNKKGEVKIKKVKTAVKANAKDGKTLKNDIRKTMYLQNGYKEFREVQGRPVDKVNLSLSGQLNSQFTIIPTENGYGLGWNNEEMFLRSGYLEKKYNDKIWALTQEEEKQAVEVANFEVSKIINR